MPKIKTKLTDIQLKNFKPQDKAYKHYDEAGLMLLVRPTGTKVWQYPYKLAGKSNIFTIGQYPEIGAAEARKKRDEVKAKLKDGLDPNLDKKTAKRRNENQQAITFEAIANEWLDKQIWATKHAKNIKNKFRADVFSKIGYLPIDQIKPSDVITVLKAIEGRGAPDVAKRTCQHIGQVFEYAIALDICDYNPAIGRAKIIKKAPVKHRLAISEADLPRFLKDLENYKGSRLVSLGFKLLILTVARSTEINNAKWAEFDLERAVWTVPQTRMKMKKPHIVHLSPQALEVLNQLKEISGKNEWLLPSVRNANKPISDGTLRKAIIVMGYRETASVHGMRGTLSTITNGHGFNADVIEKLLSHTEKNKVRAAYNHADYLKQRRDALNWWGEYLEK